MNKDVTLIERLDEASTSVTNKEYSELFVEASNSIQTLKTIVEQCEDSMKWCRDGMRQVLESIESVHIK